LSSTTPSKQSHQLQHKAPINSHINNFHLKSITMHATSLFATIVALSAAVSATPLFPRALRKANEFSSGDW
jgi:hypothetical protein